MSEQLIVGNATINEMKLQVCKIQSTDHIPACQAKRLGNKAYTVPSNAPSQHVTIGQFCFEAKRTEPCYKGSSCRGPPAVGYEGLPGLWGKISDILLKILKF
jgi:hypothetical protein